MKRSGMRDRRPGRSLAQRSASASNQANSCFNLACCGYCATNRAMITRAVASSTAQPKDILFRDECGSAELALVLSHGDEPLNRREAVRGDANVLTLPGAIATPALGRAVVLASRATA